MSAAFATTAFWIAWFERETFSRIKLPPLLSYLAGVLIAIGFVIEIDWAGWGGNWTALGTGLCAAFVAASWVLRNEPLNALYGIPLRRVGLALIVLPLIGMVAVNNPVLGIATFGIAGIALIVDAWARKRFYESYLGAGAFVVVLWYLLENAGVKELQAYAIPCGLWLLAVGLSERRRNQNGVYLGATVAGLAVLMGSAFVQSLGGLSYSVLLLAESLIALFWSVKSRSRLYAQISLLSLIANGIAQFGPGFAQLDRWIQLGLIGSILLIGGVVALVRREQILTARRNLMLEWKQWLS